jgi:acetylxylan esterase
MFILLSKVAALLLLARALVAPAELDQCAYPPIHIFGARKTTAPAGYGSTGTVVNLVPNAHSGATTEAINYSAVLVQAGVQAVTNQVSTFYASCLSTKLILVGYSQVSIYMLCFLN